MPIWHGIYPCAWAIVRSILHEYELVPYVTIRSFDVLRLVVLHKVVQLCECLSRCLSVVLVRVGVLAQLALESILEVVLSLIWCVCIKALLGLVLACDGVFHLHVLG